MNLLNIKDKAMDKKGKKSGPIKKETENNPGAAVFVDQSHPAQPGLVQQILKQNYKRAHLGHPSHGGSF